MPDLKLTIGITSCNRLKYLKALLESLECVLEGEENKDVQLIVVDNGSTEEGLADFLEGYGWIDDLVLRKGRDWINDEYHAKNDIINRAKHPHILFLQDDLQFIGTRKALADAVQDFSQMSEQNLDLNAVRRVTLANLIDQAGRVEKNGRAYWNMLNDHFTTTGLFKKDTFDKHGLYPVTWPTDKEFWGRSEDYYHALMRESTPGKLMAKAQVPLFLSVWNDPRGGYAFIRGGSRYGHYLDPPDKSGLYYGHLTDDEVTTHMAAPGPAAFVDVVKTLGWELATTPDGDQAKYSQATVVLEGPEESLGEEEIIVESDELHTQIDPEVDDWLNS